MTVSQISDHADGYENCPTWKIKYNFPSGIQQEYHPHPGQTYKSVMRRAYLPANEDGFHILMLLRLAFIRKLTFKIGDDDSITLNDLHHLIKLHGGMFSYPDPKYFLRVKKELTNKGVKLCNATELEKQKLNNFKYSIKSNNFFNDR